MQTFTLRQLLLGIAFLSVAIAARFEPAVMVFAGLICTFIYCYTRLGLRARFATKFAIMVLSLLIGISPFLGGAKGRWFGTPVTGEALPTFDSRIGTACFTPLYRVGEVFLYAVGGTLEVIYEEPIAAAVFFYNSQTVQPYTVCVFWLAMALMSGAFIVLEVARWRIKKRCCATATASEPVGSK